MTHKLFYEGLQQAALQTSLHKRFKTLWFATQGENFLQENLWQCFIPTTSSQTFSKGLAESPCNIYTWKFQKYNKSPKETDGNPKPKFVLSQLPIQFPNFICTNLSSGNAESYIVNQGLQESPHVFDPHILGLAHALDLLRDEGQLRLFNFHCRGHGCQLWIYNVLDPHILGLVHALDILRWSWSRIPWWCPWSTTSASCPPEGRGSSECRWWRRDRWLACVSPPPRPAAPKLYRGRFCHRKCRGRFCHRMLLQQNCRVTDRRTHRHWINIVD